MKPFNPIPHTGKLYVKTDKGFLVIPTPGFKDASKLHFTEIKEAAFRFSREQAQDSVNLLFWDYKIDAKIVR